MNSDNCMTIAWQRKVPGVLALPCDCRAMPCDNVNGMTARRLFAYDGLVQHSRLDLVHVVLDVFGCALHGAPRREPCAQRRRRHRALDQVPAQCTVTELSLRRPFFCVAALFCIFLT